MQLSELSFARSRLAIVYLGSFLLIGTICVASDRTAPGDDFETVATSHNRETMVLRDDRGDLRVGRWTRRRDLRRVHIGAKSCVAVDDGGRVLVAGGSTGELIAWDLRRELALFTAKCGALGRPQRRWQNHPGWM